MTAIRFEHVSKHYGNAALPAVNDVSFGVENGSLVVLLGPSGSGKTTLLKMVNRLYEVDAGAIYLDRTDTRQMELTGLRRQMGYVIQQVGLFPHMTVAENIAVTPRLLRWPEERIRSRTVEMLDLVHLPADFRSRYPAQLSGGQQQRVGLARALAADPKVLLMDEPFGALDAITRVQLQDELLQLQDRLHKTVLFVTHDVDEALRLADRIAVLREGRLEQYGEPCALLNTPANDFVSRLLNAEDRIRQLSLLQLGAVMGPLDESRDLAGAPLLPAEAYLRPALSLLLAPAVWRVIVTCDGQPVGQVTLEDVRKAGCLPGKEEPPQ